MSKRAISLTLDQVNLLWLRGRARVLAGGSLSAAVDQLIDEARAGRLGTADAPRSVVGTIDLPDDHVLATATGEMRGLFEVSLARPIFVHEDRPRDKVSKVRRKK